MTGYGEDLRNSAERVRSLNGRSQQTILTNNILANILGECVHCDSVLIM
jgi:hypothetical protein